MTLTEMQHTLTIQFQRMASNQLELDQLATTVREHIAQPHNSPRSSG